METLQLVETEVVAASVVSVEQLDVLKQDTLQVGLVTVEQVGEREIEIISDIVTEREELTSEIIDVVTDRQVLIEVIEAAGPQGPPGVVEDDVMYAKRVDFVSDDLLYRGEAAVGSLPSGAVWRIRRIAFNPLDGDVIEQWAEGNANFDKAWDDRASLVYV